jgi:polyphosphate glucokinase
MDILGIDIGGSGIKGALVDVETGNLTTERHKVLTPSPATQSAVVSAVEEVVRHFGWKGAIGCGFPGLVINGIVRTAPNINDVLVGIDSQQLLRTTTGSDVTVLNDADTAGVAEMTFGAGRDQPGTVFMLTFGTGIGSAIFRDGDLVPNAELGHLEVGGVEAEKFASAQIRKDLKLSWEGWAKRVSKVLQTYEALFSPDLFIIGGGVSRKADKFFPLLRTKYARIVPAQMQNNAGIVGAAMAAAERNG